MKTTIYIGHHKVGSTALQQFLSRNLAPLVRAGTLYPFVEMDGAAHAMATLAKGKRPPPQTVNVVEPHSALAYKMMAEAAGRPVPPQFRNLCHSSQMFHAVAGQVRLLRPEGLVLCSEAFSNFGAVQPALIDRLAAPFAEDDLTVYAALRRPDQYLVSWHGQRIKVGEKTGPLSQDWAGYLDTIHFNYHLALEAWIDRLPGARMVIRDYARIMEAGGSIQDFAAHGGVHIPDGLDTAIQANPSLPHAVVELARRGSHALSPKDGHAFREFLKRLPGKVDLPANREVEMLGQPARDALHDAFREIDGWLGEVTGGGTGFFADLDAMRTLAPMPERDANHAALDALTPELLEPLAPPLRDMVDRLRREI